jgi:hypothetical protein
LVPEQKFLSSKAASRAGLRDLLEVYVATLTLARIADTIAEHLPLGTYPALDQQIRKPLEEVRDSELCVEGPPGPRPGLMMD